MADEPLWVYIVTTISDGQVEDVSAFSTYADAAACYPWADVHVVVVDAKRPVVNHG
jgi:hypothetical protein